MLIYVNIREKKFKKILIHINLMLIYVQKIYKRTDGQAKINLKKSIEVMFCFGNPLF